MGFPEEVLADIDSLVSNKSLCRADVIREACFLYVEEKRKAALREQMKVGYQEMAELNRFLAEEMAGATDFSDDFEGNSGWGKT